MPREKERTEKSNRVGIEMDAIEGKRAQQHARAKAAERKASQNETDHMGQAKTAGLHSAVCEVLEVLFPNTSQEGMPEGSVPFAEIAGYIVSYLEANFDCTPLVVNMVGDAHRRRQPCLDVKNELVKRLSTAMRHGDKSGRWFCGPIGERGYVRSFFYNFFRPWERHVFFCPFVVNKDRLPGQIEEAVKWSAKGILPERRIVNSSSSQQAGTSASAAAPSAV